jgi:hypothetical protein
MEWSHHIKKINHVQKNKYQVFSLICRILTRKIHEWIDNHNITVRLFQRTVRKEERKKDDGVNNNEVHYVYV